MNYNKQRDKLINGHIEKYGFLFCMRCKKNTCGLKFEVHHIIYRSEQPKHKNLHHLDNLIILGSECHKWYHDKKDRREHLVNERNLKNLFK